MGSFTNIYCEACGQRGDILSADGWNTCMVHYVLAKPSRKRFDRVTGEAIPLPAGAPPDEPLQQLPNGARAAVYLTSADVSAVAGQGHGAVSADRPGLGPRRQRRLASMDGRVLPRLALEEHHRRDPSCRRIPETGDARRLPGSGVRRRSPVEHRRGDARRRFARTPAEDRPPRSGGEASASASEYASCGGRRAQWSIIGDESGKLCQPIL